MDNIEMQVFYGKDKAKFKLLKGIINFDIDKESCLKLADDIYRNYKKTNKKKSNKKKLWFS